MSKTPAARNDGKTLSVNGYTLHSIGPSSAGKPRYALKETQENVEVDGKMLTLYVNITAYEHGSAVSSPKVVPAVAFDSTKRRVNGKSAPQTTAKTMQEMIAEEIAKALAALSTKPA